MGVIKNKALKGEKKFTLSEEEINTLMQYRSVAQLNLDRMMQEMTSVYLHSIATSRFGYTSGAQLSYALDLESPKENLTITTL